LAPHPLFSSFIRASKNHKWVVLKLIVEK
jgi:hypothetical protein